MIQLKTNGDFFILYCFKNFTEQWVFFSFTFYIVKLMACRNSFTNIFPLFYEMQDFIVKNAAWNYIIKLVFLKLLFESSKAT